MHETNNDIDVCQLVQSCTLCAVSYNDQGSPCFWNEKTSQCLPESLNNKVTTFSCNTEDQTDIPLDNDGILFAEITSALSSLIALGLILSALIISYRWRYRFRMD
eukprot:gb/GECH01005795.1/.p1 GENE.gb/GECH01005795.1/~~gb/GECH01005795.1/.p1  ORF type:complete len:105 (+),score=18.56 gb/GECH01005795.1/:1-315(+)